MKAGVVMLVVLAAIAHIVLAIVFANETPYRTPGKLRMNAGRIIPDVGAPDERQHANYVENLISGHGLPVFHPQGSDVGEHYEDHQPPLYYLMAAGFAKVVAVERMDEPGALRIRYLNAFVGAATVLGVFFLGVWGLGRSDVAAGAAAIAAFLPMNCALSGAIGNDPLLFAICTWTLALCALGIRNGWTLTLAIGVGVLTGLGILTKTTAVALLPVLVIAILVPQKRRPGIAAIGAAVLAVALVGGPWIFRNQQLYGDPLAQKVFKEAFVGSAHKATMVDLVRVENPEAANPELLYWRDWVAWWTARSFFGTFGYMDIWLNETGSPYGSTPGHPAPNTVYRALIAVSAILILAWLASLFLADWKESRAVQMLNLCFLAIVIVLFATFNMTYFQGQGRYLYPAIGPIALALSVGWFVLLKQKGAIAVAAFAGVLLLASVYSVAKLPEEFNERTASAAALTSRPA